MSETEQSNKCR